MVRVGNHGPALTALGRTPMYQRPALALCVLARAGPYDGTNSSGPQSSGV